MTNLAEHLDHFGLEGSGNDQNDPSAATFAVPGMNFDLRPTA